MRSESVSTSFTEDIGEFMIFRRYGRKVNLLVTDLAEAESEVGAMKS